MQLPPSLQELHLSAPPAPDTFPSRRHACVAMIGAVLGSVRMAFATPEDRQEALAAPLCTFDGKDDCVLCPRMLYTGTTPVTIDAVVRLMEAERDQSIVSNIHSGGVGLQCKNDGHWEFVLHDGTQYRIARSDKPATIGRAVRLTGVSDGRILRLYIDGVLQHWKAPLTGMHRASKQPFFIGADPDAQGRPQHRMRGDLFALRVSAIARDAGAARAAWERDPFGKSDGFDALSLGMRDGTLQDLSRRKQALVPLGRED